MAEYIEREKALERFEELKNKADSFRDRVYLDGVMTVIDTLPAADVAPVVHGKWIYYKNAHYFKCSECKETVPYKKAVLIDGKRKYNYCPKCGAKMDGDTV